MSIFREAVLPWDPAHYLTEKQLAILDTIEWLSNPSVRGQGRTAIICSSLVRQAMKHPGERVELWDHIPASGQTKWLKLQNEEQCLHIIRDTSDEEEWKIQDNYLIYDGPNIKFDERPLAKASLEEAIKSFVQQNGFTETHEFVKDVLDRMKTEEVVNA